jgi:5-methylcytosine-specific restriction protein B
MQYGGTDETGEYAMCVKELILTKLTQDRRLVFFDVEGRPYRPVRDGGSGRSIFKIKPKGASNRAEDALHVESWLEVARAMLIDGLAARCQLLSGGQVNYLRYGARKLIQYELDAELAQVLGIPSNGVVGDDDAKLSRLKIEAAMDVYDSYRVNGENNRVFFDAFVEPHEYWVRSTRKRENRVFPTKPIVDFALSKTTLNGGWGEESAATALHNAGYIIVDQADQPAPIPPDEPFLLRDANRIRLCALNYYISPAREQGKAQVSIRVGTLHKELMLKDAKPNICQALQGKKFQELAGVPEPTKEGPDASTTTTFTYELSDHRKNIPMNPENNKHPQAINIILYGPPGTGKTYETASEAVRICQGLDAISELPEGGNRDVVMQEYRRLVSDGRIEFVTFHQSMSYEEFVEGLRPETQDKDGQETVADDSVNGGFRLKVEDGIFKRFSEQARRDPGDGDSANRLDRRRRVIRFGLTGSDWRTTYESAINEGWVEWSHGGNIDWSGPEFEDWQVIKERRQQDDPNRLGNHASVFGTWLWRAGAETGDYVLMTVGRSRIVAVGRINGDYKFIPATDDMPPRHIRPVEWMWSNPDGVDRSEIYSSDFTSFHPAYTLNEAALNWDRLETLLFGADAVRAQGAGRPHVLIIDEINRANISKVFGELITLLEPDKRIGQPNEIRLRLPYSKAPFGVPSNLHIIGTMNTADRSIALLDTALRRRFRFRELMPDPEVLSNKTDLDGINLQRLLKSLNERIEYLFDREHQIGHAYFMGCKTRDDIERVMRDNIIPLLAEYFYEDWSRIAMVLEGRSIPEAEPFDGHFLCGERFVPQGFDGDSIEGQTRMRWTVKDTFDFSEFASI